MGHCHWYPGHQALPENYKNILAKIKREKLFFVYFYSPLSGLTVLVGEMNKDINFSQLKTNFLKIYTGILGYWICIGVIFLIILSLLLIFIYPLSSRYTKAHKDLEDLSAALERYTIKKDLYNEKWITSKKQEGDLYNEEIEKCKSFLKGKDDQLEAIFLTENIEKGLTEIKDAALWKNEYLRKISTLLTQLNTNNITLSDGALPFSEWGLDIPAWDTILPAQKRFWILEALVNIITKDTGIIKLEKIVFRNTSNSYNISLSHLYTAIPITFKAELQANYITVLLYEILKSDILFVIEGITILSTDKIYSIEPLEKNGFMKGHNNYLSNPIIDITIDAYVIDYKT